MTDLTVAMVATLAGAALLVSIVEEVVIRTFAWTAATQGRFGPALAVVLGIVFCTVASAVTGVSIAQGVLTGILAGASAMGIHGLATSTGTGTT